MANSFTQIGLIKQVNGENSGTWGNYLDTNEDITTLVTGGSTGVSFTSSNVTLTSVDGTADQGKNRSFVCTGTLTANVALIVPNKSREYVIVNNCTGAFTLTVKTAAGTGIVVPQTTSGNGGLMVYCDATNVYYSISLPALGGISTSSVNSYTAQQNIAKNVLTYGSTVAWNLNTQQSGELTLTGNATLSNPTNMIDMGQYTLRVIQGTASSLLSYGTAYDFGTAGAPVLSTSLNAIDYLSFVSNGTQMHLIGIARGY